MQTSYATEEAAAQNTLRQLVEQQQLLEKQDNAQTSKTQQLQPELETAKVNAKNEEREVLRSQSEQHKIFQEHYTNKHTN